MSPRAAGDPRLAGAALLTGLALCLAPLLSACAGTAGGPGIAPLATETQPAGALTAPMAALAAPAAAVAPAIASGAVDSVTAGPAAPPPAAPRPVRLGLLCPLTGRYALLGNAFHEGAELARRHALAAGGDSVEFLVADTGGDPVTAALAARRLARDGAAAILGGLLSATTVAAALVAQEEGVPLVSPTATNDRIWRLGDRIFQTNLTATLEARLLAGAATQVLLKRRFAILAPASPEGLREMELFADEVRRQGGEVAATVTFDPEQTDFADQLLEVRDSRPEVLYVPATVEQMVLIAPQIEYQQVGAMLMGPSGWNSPRLREALATVPSRTIFPAEDLSFPPAWAERFHREWRPESLPEEATPVALKAYQAATLVLTALREARPADSAALAAALRERLAGGQVDPSSLAGYAEALRMQEGSEVRPFPSELFAGTWQPPREAAAEGSEPEGDYAP